MPIEFLEHTADAGVRITAPTPEEFIAEAARGFYAVLLEEGCRDRVEERQEVAVELKALDGEMLLVDFLNHLLYLFDARRLLLPSVQVDEVRLGPGGAMLRARLRGEEFQEGRHALATGVKAATYHGLEIRRTPEGLHAEVIFDL